MLDEEALAAGSGRRRRSWRCPTSWARRHRSTIPTRGAPSWGSISLMGAATCTAPSSSRSPTRFRHHLDVFAELGRPALRRLVGDGGVALGGLDADRGRRGRSPAAGRRRGRRALSAWPTWPAWRPAPSRLARHRALRRGRSPWWSRRPPRRASSTSAATATTAGSIRPSRNGPRRHADDLGDRAAGAGGVSALVTGAATGIGAAIAEALSAAGFAVAVTDRRRRRGERDGGPTGCARSLARRDRSRLHRGGRGAGRGRAGAARSLGLQRRRIDNGAVPEDRGA